MDKKILFICIYAKKVVLLPRFWQTKLQDMNKHSIFALFILLFAGLLSGCKEDINLREIDTQAELEMGFAIPMETKGCT